MSFDDAVQGLGPELTRLSSSGRAPASEVWNALVVVLLRKCLEREASQRRLGTELLQGGRLYSSVPGFERDGRDAARDALAVELDGRALDAAVQALGPLSSQAFGQLYESLLAARPTTGPHSLRKRTGSYYTPEGLTSLVVGRAFDALSSSRGGDALADAVRILDPALGAGAFLTQAARELARRSGRSLRAIVARELFGVDVSPLAVAVAEASLWLLVESDLLSLSEAGQNLHEADALCTPSTAPLLGRRAVDWVAAAPGGFDLVVGNPPWVAFAGRATQPLPSELRAHYRQQFRSFSGYPTLHALFVELAARLASRGVLALLIPSPVADLNGYRHMRSSLAASHAVCEPLLELGQDAFANVTQPCFALVAVPRMQPEPSPERAWLLSERRRADAEATQVAIPSALSRVAALPSWPAELFGEMGLQTNRAVTQQLLYRGATPPPEYDYALLEGRNVAEFALGRPRLFLKPDRALLSRLRCRLREPSDYGRVKLVVRQTAAITIAAAHDGTPFRNSLLAGFELAEFPSMLTLGLLNSTLYRALHLAGRRDARQGAFPQVKIAHLRALPAPPPGGARARIAELAGRASAEGLTLELRRELDAAVCAAFDVSPSARSEIEAFVRGLSPKAGLSAPLG